MIPYHWFWQEFRAIPAVQAMAELQLARGVSLAHAGKDHAPRLVEELRRRIYGES